MTAADGWWQHLLRGTGAGVVLALVLMACGPAEPDEGPGVPAGGSGAPAGEGSAAGPLQEPEIAVPEPPPAPEPPPSVALDVTVEPTEGSLWVGQDGGTVDAGSVRIGVPASAMPSAAMVTAKLLPGVHELTEPPLPGAVLAVLEAGPANPGYLRALTVTVPLNRDVEPGTPLELLGWQPSMRSYLVIGTARVAAGGRTATFSVRQLGQMYVRAAPVVREGREERCEGPNVGYRRAWPGATEDQVVGLVPEDQRLRRELAFNLLTDFRLAHSAGLVDFKNEEVRENAATRRSELAHVDEDFLMDPNAAAALTVLGHLVEREWYDPISGLPAYRFRVTEAYDALIEHSARSTHYQGRAIDLTLSPVPAANPEERRDRYGRLSRLSVCAGFDYVLFENDFHVHASVLPTRVAFVVRDASGARHVLTAPLTALETPTPALAAVVPPQRFSDFVWAAPGTFEFPGAGRVLADTAFASTAAAPRTVAATHDGLRRVVVHNGQAWLLNERPVPQPGVLAEDGTAVDIVYPFPAFMASEGSGTVEDAAFLVHLNTATALRRYLGGH